MTLMELIQELQRLFDKHGDLVVENDHGERVAIVEFNEDDYPAVLIEFGGG